MRMLTVEQYLAWLFATSFLFTDATRFCDFLDPCTAEITYLPFPERRTDNCGYQQDQKCDDLISSTWYKTDELMLDYCPGKSCCGALYPIWLNGSEPSVNDGVVERMTCLVGTTCCDRTYKIKIKNCTSFQAYCLGSTTGCPERYCFGQNGSCLEPTTTSTTSSSTKPVDMDTITPQNDRDFDIIHERNHDICLPYVAAVLLYLFSFIFGGIVVFGTLYIRLRRNSVDKDIEEYREKEEDRKECKCTDVANVVEPTPMYKENENNLNCPDIQNSE